LPTPLTCFPAPFSWAGQPKETQPISWEAEKRWGWTLVLQPPSVLVTIPGPILSASGEPVAVGGNTPRAPAGGFGQGISDDGLIGIGLLGI
uniref:Uncharacterized protein n=1 Tax=Naja naja TaxID=35670 RepID=A0A8C6XRD2_NAJNA